MSRPPLPAWSKIAGVGVPVTGGGSWLITLAGVPKTTAVVIAAALLAVTSIATAIAYALPRIVESIQQRKATILKARREVIAAESEARISHRWTKTYTKIAKKGLDSPEKAEQAERMLRMLALSPGLKEKQRLPDDVLDRHLTPPKNKTIAKKPGIPPKGSSGGGRVVLPFPPTDDLSTRRSTRIPYLPRQTLSRPLPRLSLKIENRVGAASALTTGGRPDRAPTPQGEPPET
jgi:hypothetical protein